MLSFARNTACCALLVLVSATAFAEPPSPTSPSPTSPNVASPGAVSPSAASPSSPQKAGSGDSRGGAAEDLEPAVNTSAVPDARPTAPQSGATAAAPAAPASPAASGSETGKSAAAAGARDAQHAVGERAGTTAQASPRKGGKPGNAMDRLELDTTQITGNRELPKVMYIVPWKRSDLGDLMGKPANSLLDEVLEPVDRDVFKRENRYYRAVAPGEGAGVPGAGDAVRQSSAGGSPAPAPGARDER